MASFWLRLIGISGILGLTIAILQKYLGAPWVHPQVWNILLFFTLFVGITRIVMVRKGLFAGENTTSMLLGLTVIRVLGSLAFISYMLFTNINDVLWFVVNFFLIYLLYLIFDIHSLIANLRPHSR